MYVKLCGLTRLEQAAALVETGPDAIGVNLIKSSKRAVSFDLARELVRAVREAARAQARSVECVGLAQLDRAEGVRELRRELDFDRVQLCEFGAEESLAESRLPELLRQVLALASEGGASVAVPWAFAAARIETAADVAACADWPSSPLVLDAKLPGALGGTGHRFDWRLATELARRRAVLLAGGLTPDNVAEGVRVVRPWGVDVASGVEAGTPGLKDIERCRQFVERARAAALEVGC